MMFKLYCRTFQCIMKYSAYALPWRKPRLIAGEGSIDNLPDYIKEMGVKSVLLVTGKVTARLGLADKLIDALKRTGINIAVYSDTVPNPTIDNIEEALAVYKMHNCEGIIAFGGGSAMDCAKGVGARVARPKKSIQRMRGLLKILRPLPPLYAVPTTAGSGSEATVASVVVDAQTHEKYAIMDPALIPCAAVLDPLLTLELPPATTATTGMDTLTHAVEAYIGRSNTKETREMALKTVELVFQNLFTAYSNGRDIEARKNMQLAAYYGGIAFTRAYVGNVHAVSHALAAKYGTAHGLANAVILPHILDDYGDIIYRPLSELADAAGLAGETKQLKAKAFIEAIRELNTKMEIPSTIEGIAENDISDMAESAYREANPTYPVPRIFSRADFKRVIRKLTVV